MRGATAGGAALFAGAKWTTPVVKNIVLPAHAGTSRVTSLSDPCDIDVTIPSPGSQYMTTVSGNLLGDADSIDDVDGSVTLRYLNCFGELIFDQTLPVTTAGDGSYSVDFEQTGIAGGCPNTYIVDIVARVSFPGIDQVDCPSHVKDCPCD